VSLHFHIFIVGPSSAIIQFNYRESNGAPLSAGPERRSSEQQQQFGDDVLENIHTKLYGPLNAPFFTYNNVPWTLHVRKELFSPSENSLSHPLALHLVFCQVVHDTYDEACVRIGREDRRRMQLLLDNYGIDPSNAADGHHKITLKRNVVETAKQWPLYFARLYPVSVRHVTLSFNCPLQSINFNFVLSL
jgi:myosin-15